MFPEPRQFRRTIHERSSDAMLALLEQRGIHDHCVLAAMTEVAREPFVAAADVGDAYADRALSIGHGQTISQPYVVAVMLEALELKGHERVLEIGTGSGYSAAVLSKLTLHVDTIERDPVLAATARKRLATLGYDDIEVRCADGTLGWPAHGLYDAIVVAAGGPIIPTALVDQLVVGGRLVMPVGSRESQYLALLTKTGEHGYRIRDLGPVMFVPLVGEHGWPEVA